MRLSRDPPRILFFSKTAVAATDICLLFARHRALLYRGWLWSQTALLRQCFSYTGTLMKKFLAVFCLIGLFNASCPADTFRTLKGQEYKDVTVTSKDIDSITVMTDSGVERILFTNLPADIQKKYGYDPELARHRVLKEASNPADQIVERQPAPKEAVSLTPAAGPQPASQETAQPAIRCKDIAPLDLKWGDSKEICKQTVLQKGFLFKEKESKENKLLFDNAKFANIPIDFMGLFFHNDKLYEVHVMFSCEKDADVANTELYAKLGKRYGDADGGNGRLREWFFPRGSDSNHNIVTITTHINDQGQLVLLYVYLPLKAEADKAHEDSINPNDL